MAIFLIFLLTFSGSLLCYVDVYTPNDDTMDLINHYKIPLYNKIIYCIIFCNKYVILRLVLQIFLYGSHNV